MKKVECIIHAEKVQSLLDTLVGFDVWGVTEIPVRGCGRQKGYYSETDYKDTTKKVKLLPFVKLEFVVKDEVVEGLVNRILETAKTGSLSMGNGKIFIYSCEDSIRISTGERGIEAISE